MSAVMEIDHSAIENFKMPPVKVGQEVLWYPGGERTGRDPHVAWVMKCSSRNMSIKTVGGLRYDAVRHIDDPKLKMSDSQRENGAWDYTDAYKDQQSRWERVNEQIAALDSKIAALQSANTALVAEKARGGKLSIETVKNKSE